MTFCLLLIGDGRDEYHDRTVESAKEMLPTPDKLVKIDDRDHKLGFAGAIQAGWDQVLETGCDWCFHLEADFTFNRPVQLGHMIAILEQHPHLTQLALKRQPVNKSEKRAGGIVELSPDNFHQRYHGGHVWTEHRRYGFTTNPSLYPVALCGQGWPLVERSEGIFGLRLLEDPEACSAIWGGKFDPPMVEHIGTERAGNGY